MFKGQKANMGASLLIGILLFNIICYIFIYSANQDLATSIGSYGSMEGTISGTNSTDDISITRASAWTDGFRVSVFNLPWYVNIFYVTFQLMLLTLSIYMLIRGI